MQTVAIIPARSGSKGVPGKNIRLLAGHPLLAWSICLAKSTKSIDRVIVSTNDSEYAKIALDYGAEVPFLRPLELSSDSSTDLDFLQHAYQWLLKNEGRSPQSFVLLRPTTPLRDPSVVNGAIEQFYAQCPNGHLRSAHIAQESPLKWFTKSKNGFFQPLGTSADAPNLPRQAFQDVYVPDGYVDVISISAIEAGLKVPVSSFISPQCLEVDSEGDFELIQAAAESSILKNRGAASILINELNKYGAKTLTQPDFPSSIRHMGITVGCVALLSDFYCEKFGFVVASNEIEEGEFLQQLIGNPKAKIHIVKLRDKNGVVLELLHYLEGQSAQDNQKAQLNCIGHAHLALTVSNLTELFNKLCLKSVEFVNPPKLNPLKTAMVAFCRDPEGNYIELVEVLAKP
jgi:CMP-N,N'-diacetyllegionaminic acid synthase